MDVHRLYSFKCGEKKREEKKIVQLRGKPVRSAVTHVAWLIPTFLACQRAAVER
jgi:hypothetical protein